MANGTCYILSFFFGHIFLSKYTRVIIYMGPYLAVLDDAHSLLGREEGEMGKAHSGAVGEVHETAHLALLVLHQGLIRNRVDLAHIGVGVFVRIEDTCGDKERERSPRLEFTRVVSTSRDVDYIYT